MKWLAAFLVPVVVAMLTIACGEEEGEAGQATASPVATATATAEGTPSPEVTPTSAPSASEIETPLATFIIREVQVTDRIPPDCDLEVQYSCFGQADEGYQIIVVWLERKDGGNPAQIGGELENLSEEAYVVASDGSRGDRFVGGMLSRELFVAFTAPASAHDFELLWPGNPPVDLGK